MGLIMLILIGAAPTAYALNRTLPDASAPGFEVAAAKAQTAFAAHADAPAAAITVDQARGIVGDGLRTQKLATPQVYGALGVLAGDIGTQVKAYGSIKHVPAAATPNLRNDMYLAGDATRLLMKGKSSAFSKPEAADLKAFQGGLEHGTRFIPTWVKVGVAIALGLGTMVGWKRIVVTVGEKIGKTWTPDLRARLQPRPNWSPRSPHHAGRPVQVAGLDHPHPVQRRGGHHGRQRVGLAAPHPDQHRAGPGFGPCRRRSSWPARSTSSCGTSSRVDRHKHRLHRSGALSKTGAPPTFGRQAVIGIGRDGRGSEARMRRSWRLAAVIAFLGLAASARADDSFRMPQRPPRPGPRTPSSPT